ncbi:hypothetical protein [Serratia marcescens]|uniref:hypothetical protein n=1 Tax=Serratia marcescens TaxID=615 RepID=UPI001DB90B90|nr:hypothetical protein [Serratia marcescens]CAF2554893.1 hypothetical protein AI2857V1_3424 [Serratia marcescens]CAH5397578.1 hypothetical protein AI2857V1_3424 [Serratia marcescens]
MADNSFFNNVDKKIAEKQQEQKKEKTRLDEERAFLSQIVESLVPKVEFYKEGLLERGIYAELSSSSRYICFKMKYKDGGRHDLLLSETQRFDGGITMTTESTNDDGRTYTSTDGSSYKSNNWDNDIFIQKLEKHINDYLFYAERHGGL